MSEDGSAARRLRFLLTTPVPFSRELGLSRIPADFAAELRLLGHSVEVFDAADLFTNGRASRIRRLQPLRFSRRARSFVRANAARFDVIEATQGDLPYSKAELGFRGLLVARSPGLFHFYDAYDQFARRRWPEYRRGTPLGRVVHRWAGRRRSAASRRSVLSADIANVANESEYMYLRDELGLGTKALLMPLCLRDEDAAALRSAALAPEERLASKHVAFVGSWSLRKGLADWGEIVVRTRALAPGTRFSFLGTGASRETILRDLRVEDVDWIEIVPRYEPGQLPALLADATVGAFPSYAEAWGLGVLEQLAAGLPVVAYDIAGPRDMLLGLQGGELLVPRGDTDQFAARLGEVLGYGARDYAALSVSCLDLSRKFRWSRLAPATVDVYTAALDELRRRAQRGVART